MANETAKDQAADVATVKRRPGGKRFSACVALLVMLQASSAQAATAGTQIEQALRQHLQPMLERETRQLGWQQPRLSLDLNLPASVGQLPTCSRTPQVQSLSGRQELLARQRYRLSCAQPQWSQDVTAQAKVSVLLLVARHTLDRDQALTAEDVKVKRQELARHDRGFFGKAEQVVGQTAKRRIRAGQMLSAELLDAPLWVRRGQSVTIRARHDGIEASTLGEALANGREGEIVRVRNRSSEKIIDAQVIGDGVVTSTWR
ncbi:MAG TPA: flagellar basal body P-ring formation chaperone FlgA [Pseudomonas sp.]|nr:flagellar basal body P-ring formation chaperone FlgA [Pseudomonas sp.]